MVHSNSRDLKKFLTELFLWKCGLTRDKVAMPPEDFSYPISDQVPDSDKPSVMWVNHSTFLINVGGYNILTDPIYFFSCSPIFFLGPKRKHDPGVAFSDLPKIDYVLISHDHYDHLDRNTVLALKKVYPDLTWIVPKGIKKWFSRRGIEKVVELDLFEDRQLDNFSVTAVPVKHFSGRSLFDYNKTLAAGYVLEFPKQGKKLYFAGDTGYDPEIFNEIGQRWLNMDLSLIPIGAYTPRKFMSPVHVNPYEAVEIHQMIGSKLSIGMHWKTFNLSDEPMDRPPYDLYLALKEKQIDHSEFLAIEPGILRNW